MTSSLRKSRRTTARCKPTRATATVKWGLVALAFGWTSTVSAQPDVPRPLPLQPPAAGQTQRDTTPSQDQRRETDRDLEEEGRFEPPSKEELFRLESESSFLRRMQLRKRIQQQNAEYTLPPETSITGTLAPRAFLPQQATLFPSYVVYHPLYFQQINAERYGWELGVFQPLVSTAQFYGDVLLMPYKVAYNPPWTCDANTGYNLPGNPEPLRFLTVPFSWRGVAAEVGAAVGGAAIFP
jgi:hypothetical protein